MSKDKSEESQVLSNKVTQDIELAMKPVADLSQATPTDKDYDHAHSTLASGICALRDADKITYARTNDIKSTVDRIDNRLADRNGHVHTIKWRGKDTGFPSKYVFYLAALLMGVIGYLAMHDKLSDVANAVRVFEGKDQAEIEAVTEGRLAQKEM